MENGQQPDGSITLPEALHPHMGGTHALISVARPSFVASVPAGYEVGLGARSIGTRRAAPRNVRVGP